MKKGPCAGACLPSVGQEMLVRRENQVDFGACGQRETDIPQGSTQDMGVLLVPLVCPLDVLSICLGLKLLDRLGF